MNKILTLILFCIISLSFQAQTKESKLKEVISLRKKSKNQKNSLNERLQYAIESVEIAKNIKQDSSILLSNRQLSVLFYENGQYEDYLNLTRSNILLADKLNDSMAIALANDNLARYYHSVQENDSAYFYYSKALNFYNLTNELEQKATILLNIADIQDTEKDYIGSEENAIKSLRVFETLPKTEDIYESLWILNNLLGIISLKLGDYEKSLEYHYKAESIADDMREGFYNKIFSINNRAFVYREQNQYEKSLELYDELRSIKNEYNEYDPTFYPLVLDNYAYTKFVAGDKDYNTIEKLFKEAYSISARLGDPITKLQVSIDISKFYLQQKKIDSSLKYANISYKLAKETSSNEILLDVLEVLSELKEGEEGKDYLKEHIKLSDSLLNLERNKRNKFARIEFETDKIEEENEKITEQRLWLIITSIGLLFTIFLLYIIVTQRAKNKELKFEKDQQKANEEIYNLMLSQQDKVDEARANEKIRISEELHDGILGRLFGTRLSLDSFNFSEGKEAIHKRASYISELKIIEDDIRKISHDLNTDFVSGSGFMGIVSELIEKQTEAYQLQSSFVYTDDINWEMVTNKAKINIYRIIQESLQNIYKHANAKLVKISFQLKNNVICLSIIDDGDGFDANKSKKGIGLKNINSRVEEVGGNVRFNSKINQGTEVEIMMPYKN
ncbi:tetratricopeptide repeat-containing sensor histidine kinase [Psychroserpens sp. Hel_I_66]|uniref:tetratricopeptide repeat-containing sensor histidine kinase n=1 Tax=Psychroserpens sp. Hel_I_66 TaxID=1250004 RepID=UPI0012E02548|nr:tetratricopeptide repeat-containing sensor histidine kinase [Psychroserpens sp. Hel_I_66]